MNVNLNGLPVHKKNNLSSYLPVIETEKVSKELPSIVINGKKPINDHWFSIMGFLLSRSTRQLLLIKGAKKKLSTTWMSLMKRG